MKNTFKVPKTVTMLQPGPSSMHDADGILPAECYRSGVEAGSKREEMESDQLPGNILRDIRNELNLCIQSKRRMHQTREVNLTSSNQTHGKEVSIQRVPAVSSCKEDDQATMLYEETIQSTHSPKNVNCPKAGIVPMDDKMILQRFEMIIAITQRYQLNPKKNKVDAYPIEKVVSFFSSDATDFTEEKQNLSRSFFEGVNTCKERELTFIRFDGTHQAIPSRADCRLSMTEMPNSCTVSVSIQDGVTEDSQCCQRTVHTLPTTHYTDLFAAQYNVLMERDGYCRTEDKTRHVQFRAFSAYSIDSIAPATSLYNVPPEVNHAKMAPPPPSSSSVPLGTNSITLVASSPKDSYSVLKSASGNSNQTLPLVQQQPVSLQQLPLPHVRRLASELLGRNATLQSVKQKMHDILSTHFQLQMLLIQEKKQQLNRMSEELMTGHCPMSIQGSSSMVPESGLGNMKTYQINMGETSSFGAALPPGPMPVVQAVAMASKLRFVRLNMHSSEPSGIRDMTGNHSRLPQNSSGTTMPSHWMYQDNINTLQQNAMLPTAPPRNMSVLLPKGKEEAAKLRDKRVRHHKALVNSSDVPTEFLSSKRLRLTNDGLLDDELQQTVKDPSRHNSAASLNGNNNKNSPRFRGQRQQMQVKQLPLPLVQKLASQLLGRNASLQSINQKMCDILSTNLQLQMLLLDDKERQQNTLHGMSITGNEPMHTGNEPMRIRRSYPVIPLSGSNNVNPDQKNLGEAEALPPRSMSVARAVAMASKLSFVKLDMHNPGPSGVTRMMTGNHNWMLQKSLPGRALNEPNINNLQQNALSSMAPPKHIEASYFRYSPSQLQLQQQKLASQLETVAPSQCTQGEPSQSDDAREWY